MARRGSGCDRFASEVQETTELHFESTQEKNINLEFYMQEKYNF